MKTKITLFVALLLVSFTNSYAQNEEDCRVKLSLMTEATKAKNFDDAEKHFKELRQECPKYSRAIYKYGEDILEYRIKNATGADKAAQINDLMKLWEERATYFASKTPKGEYLAKAAQLVYNNKEALGKSKEDLYAAFDKAYTTDKKSFKNPKSLYTYFSLIVDLYDGGKKSAQELFDKYDDVAEKIENEVDNYSKKLNKLVSKETASTGLSSKEKKYKKSYASYLKAYDKIGKSMDQKLGNRANCENLIPLYQKDYEQNKDNAVWLQRAMNKLYSKGCKSDPMFVKIVKQKNTVEPNAKTAYYLYLITGEQQYFDQTLALETDPIKKAKLYNTIAKDFKDSGSYGKARTYYKKALELNPSNGRPHLSIAAMYARSANSCGTTTFNKRAVFWLAANEARKAGRVDPTLSKAASQTAANYMAKAPSKADIFSEGNAGKSVRIGCWIGSSVSVPNL